MSRPAPFPFLGLLMHHDSPDAPHIAAAPGVFLSCDSACPPNADPGDATLANHVILPTPALPQSHPEAARHCLQLIEAAVAEPLVANLWAAVEAVERAKAAEVKARCVEELRLGGWLGSDPSMAEWDIAAKAADAVESLPLEAP